ncbi:peptidase M20 [Spirochaetia bacterium]|nr:peptidase M20 [Spirochaetia bacterium]
MSDAIERLSRAIQIPTVSASNYEATDFAPFDAFLAFLEDAFPLFHSTCETERINIYARLYRWRGKDPSRKPVLFTAHYDVVPAGNEDWTHPPFSGLVADGRVWGRGTLDIKSQLTAHIEAAEALMREGFKPEGDIYFAYGHDEEVGGRQGAEKIVALLTERGIKLGGLLDEGGMVVTGALSGVKSPVALIGVAEKASVHYEITVQGSGGHSSMPPATTALGQVAEIIRRIEKNPLPARFTPPVLAMLKNIGPEMGGVTAFAIRHALIFSTLLKRVLSKKSTTNAMIRTTFAATQSKASDAVNVLPLSASVTVNVRLLSGDTVASVTEYFKKLAGEIPVSIRQWPQEEATPISPQSGYFYEGIVRETKLMYPDAIVTPYLMLGGSDSRKYTSICENIYRFTPVSVTNAEKDTIHNRNEYISVENYTRMIEFFGRLMRKIN